MGLFSLIQASSTSTLQGLFRELILCQERQACLLEQIQQHLTTSKSRSRSTSAFFLPLDTSSSQCSQPLSSLQDAFQQRKSSFIHQSNERVEQIYRHQKKSHQRIIPRLAQCNNTYLQEKRQSEYDRLCTMIIKHQNRQNAKIYGNFIKTRLRYEWIDLRSSNWMIFSFVLLLLFVRSLSLSDRRQRFDIAYYIFSFSFPRIIIVTCLSLSLSLFLFSTRKLPSFTLILTSTLLDHSSRLERLCFVWTDRMSEDGRHDPEKKSKHDKHKESSVSRKQSVIWRLSFSFHLYR